MDSTELFVSIFLQHPRTCCEDVLQKEDSLGTRLSSNGTSSIVVQVSRKAGHGRGIIAWEGHHSGSMGGGEYVEPVEGYYTTSTRVLVM